MPVPVPNVTRRSRIARRALGTLQRPTDAAGLAAFRMMFGAVVAFGALRFLWNGWVTRFFVEPTFFFKYWGFAWVEPLAPWAMHAAFAVLAALGILVAVGLFYRAASVALFLLFTYVELVDVTNYLNHYYLVSLLAFLMMWLPAERLWSVDAWRRPERRSDWVPAWPLYALRWQVGLVYFYAALAKAGTDWLVHGQPLGIWMHARTDVPLVGPWLTWPWVASAMGWAGFLNDLLAAPLLLWRRTRPWMYAVLIVFHAFTKVFFHIGLFPVIMLMAATVFFDPSWPRRLGHFVARRVAPPVAPVLDRAPALPFGQLGLPWAAALGGFLLLQAALPLRTHLYGGNVLWHEQGMRFSWRVMVREKNGAVTFHVRLPRSGRTVEVPPARYLTDYQEREMSSQPDLILQLAHHIRDDFRARGHGDVEVRAEAWVSLNGRRAARLIDPTVDLARVSDGLAVAPWITAHPTEPPRTTRGALAEWVAGVAP